MKTMRGPAAPAAAVLALLTAVLPVHSQVVPSDSVPLYRLDEVTVTSPRSSVDRSRIPQKIDVVTSIELDRTGGVTAAEVLRQAVPVDVIEYPGLLTGVSIRGFRPQYTGINPTTLVLQNGRPAGTTNLALLGLGGVERIEVMRGPASALYGSSAMGGVVNVITRRTIGDVAGRASVTYGSFGDYEARMATGGRLVGKLDFDLALSASGRRSGYQPGSRRTFAGDSMTKILTDGTVTQLPWTSADSTLSFSEYGAWAGSLRLGYALAQRWRLDVIAEGVAASDVENPGDLNVVDWDPRTVKDLDRHSFEATISGLLPRSSPTLKLFSTREAIDYYDAPLQPRYVNFRTPVTTHGAQLQDGVRWGGQELTLGIDYTVATGRSEAFNEDGSRGAPYSPDSSIGTAAGFAQLRSSLLGDRLVATVGSRVDRVAFEVLVTPGLEDVEPNRETHWVFAPSAGVRYTLVDGVQLTGNVGRGFVTPTAFNVAGYSEQRAGADRASVTVTRGNPDLRPETSRSWDLGVSLGRPDALDLELTYFSTSVRDRIVSATRESESVRLTPRGDTILATTTYHNVDAAEMRGLEGRASYHLGATPLLPETEAEVFVAATRMLRAEERFLASGADQRIRNVADLTVIAGLDIRRPIVGGRLTARYVGERIDSDYLAWWEPGEIVYPPYLVLDVATDLRVTDRYTLGIDLRNVMNEDYFEVRGYNLPGRALRFTARAEL